MATAKTVISTNTIAISGGASTGYLDIGGITSGKLRVTVADATAQTVTLTVAAQTSGASTLTIPDFAGVNDTLAFITLAQTLSNKTLAAPVISTGLTASGSASNDFSGSTGTFKTSSGTNTLSGTVSLAANKDFACASGTTAVDWSLGTGTFKTTTGTNTLSGNTLFKIIATPVAATGAGGGVAGAAALGAGNILTVSSDGSTKGVKLLTGVAGDLKWIINTSSTACNLFAASGGTINGGSADAGCAIPASKGVLAFCTAADTWTVHDFTARAGAAA